MFDTDDLGAAERWVDEWEHRSEQQVAKARELASRLAGLTASAQSSDRLVTVTVTAPGVTELRLAEGIRQRPASETATAILETMRAARTQLSREAVTAAEETLGVQSEISRALMAGFLVRNV